MAPFLRRYWMAMLLALLVWVVVILLTEVLDRLLPVIKVYHQLHS
ncbi:hypothetical protein QII46_gp4 [ssRNA phage Gerhypos.1_41]|uniref:Uncharacterized protein n=2 Tax=Norzivirales TaxID=2842247 RepID=A0A8S5KZS0_9VIRU|nr:hypothetical protein QII46_gp4 [ssRNA phage Gerhypos.1_41]QDH88768.1 MAG: hypothetical protein H1Bulk30212_000004 [Leviviridae sp.]DAD50354.1 TPA_asm: hypothetical protein [ssRNA phage Gerhypos.1_41]